MDHNYIVYIHTTPNGKRYVGITSQKPTARFQNGLGYKKSLRFYGAIQKYGWENIRHNILFENLSKEEAEKKEIELIALYKSNNRKYGYNIANGGNTIGTLAQETKNKLALAHIGTKASAETRKKQSERHIKENLSADTLQKMRESHIGKKKSTDEKIKIGNSNRGKKNTPLSIKKMINAKRHKAKPFIQYTKDGTCVKEYSSLSAYERETGRNKRQIGRCLKGECETAYGYIWKYKGECDNV